MGTFMALRWLCRAPSIFSSLRTSLDARSFFDFDGNVLAKIVYVLCTCSFVEAAEACIRAVPPATRIADGTK